MEIDLAERLNVKLKIPDDRFEELKNITSDIMNSMIKPLKEDNTYSLDIGDLVLAIEDRKDLVSIEKILCSFQMGMNAHRLLSPRIFNAEK